MVVGVLFVSSMSGIVFDQSAHAVIDNSQSAKNIDQYFKFQLCVKDPDHEKLVIILPNGICKPGEWAHDKN